MPGTKLLNLDLVATEVAAALSGSLGLVCTIPLTALFAAMLMSRESQVENSALLNLGNPEEAQANPKKKLSKLKRKD